MEYDIDISKFVLSHAKDVLLKLTANDLEVTTKSGIIFEINPDPVLHRPTTGIVYKKGKKVKDIEEGNLVCFTKEAGADIKTKDGWFVLMDSSKILGKYC